MKSSYYDKVLFEVEDKWRLDECRLQYGDKTTTTINTIRHSLDISFNKGIRYSELSKKFVKVIEDSKMKKEAIFPLLKPTTINDSEIVLNTYKLTNYREFMFSLLLANGDYDTLSFKNFDNGVCVIVPVYPDTLQPKNSPDEVKEFINSNTEFFYIKELKSLVNIIGIDLLKENKYYSYNTVPYGLYPDFYLSEPMVIGGLIVELEKQFPDIQFYNVSSKRDNSNKYEECVYYDAEIHQEKSHRFNSNVVKDPKYGRVIKSTIPINFRYETPSAKRFMERRHQALVWKFINKLSQFYFDIDANKYYSYSDEGFSGGVNWDRNVIENSIQYSQDNSDRVIYSFSLRCDVFCSIIEKSSDPYRIDEVINFIYTKSSTDNNTKLAKLEDYYGY